MIISSGEWAGLKSFCSIEIGSRGDNKVALLVSKEKGWYRASTIHKITIMLLSRKIQTKQISKQNQLGTKQKRNAHNLHNCNLTIGFKVSNQYFNVTQKQHPQLTQLQSDYRGSNQYSDP